MTAVTALGRHYSSKTVYVYMSACICLPLNVTAAIILMTMAEEARRSSTVCQHIRQSLHGVGARSTIFSSPDTLTDDALQRRGYIAAAAAEAGGRRDGPTIARQTKPPVAEAHSFIRESGKSSPPLPQERRYDWINTKFWRWPERPPSYACCWPCRPRMVCDSLQLANRETLWPGTIIVGLTIICIQSTLAYTCSLLNYLQRFLTL